MADVPASRFSSSTCNQKLSGLHVNAVKDCPADNRRLEKPNKFWTV